MGDKWVVPLVESMTAMEAEAPEWLKKRVSYWVSGSEIHVLTTTGVLPTYSGDTLELVPDNNFGTSIKIVKKNGT